jgi:hypothetical protein
MTRKRRKRQKTKRGGLGAEVYMMTGIIVALNGMMSSFGSTFTECADKLPQTLDANDQRTSPT